MAQLDRARLEEILAQGAADVSRATRGVYVMRGVPRPLTNDDIITVAKMVEAEGAWECELHAAVLIWAVAQRQAYFRGTQSMSFGDYIRAFSQPLNPAWARGGEYCTPPISPRNASGCQESAFVRRERFARMTWDDIRPSAKRFALKWAAGQLRNPTPGIIDFAAGNVGQNKPGYVPAAKFGNNRFYIDTSRGTDRWTGAEVFIADANGVRVSEAGIRRTTWDGLLTALTLVLPNIPGLRRRTVEYNVADLSQGCDILSEP
jgi:hypothetical protein